MAKAVESGFTTMDRVKVEIAKNQDQVTTANALQTKIATIVALGEAKIEVIGVIEALVIIAETP